jgi:tripeptide aminopeptidase
LLILPKSDERSQHQTLDKPIRGGTDGCQLSYMGLPCPNILQAGTIFMVSMNMFQKVCKKAVEVIVKIAELTALPTFD